MPTKILKSLFILIVSCVFSFIFFGCASDEKVADTPEELFKIAQEYDEAERYDIAIQKYAELKNKFPYSSLATTAELAIADLQYKREFFSEAQIAFQNFRDLHPKHSKIDYVIFKTGMSFFMQLPDSIDRDLAAAHDAIYHFDEVLKKYPQSAFAKEAAESREKSFQMLAQKEVYIADFYWRQKKYEPALTRYENVLAKYSGYGLDAKALLGSVRTASKLNNDQKKRKYADLLRSKFADSDEAKAVIAEGL